MTYIYPYASPLGGITLASDGEALIGLWFENQQHFGSTLDEAREARELPVFDEAARWLDAYFAGQIPDFTPPIRLIGTPFQRAVWDILLAVPFGQTTTYGEIAAKLPSKPTSPRAVGSAVGRNPISIIVPCHRVLGANGSLTGYAGGVERKRRLLELESNIANR